MPSKHDYNRYDFFRTHSSPGLPEEFKPLDQYIRLNCQPWLTANPQLTRFGLLHPSSKVDVSHSAAVYRQPMDPIPVGIDDWHAQLFQHLGINKPNIVRVFRVDTLHLDIIPVGDFQLLSGNGIYNTNESPVQYIKPQGLPHYQEFVAIATAQHASAAQKDPKAAANKSQWIRQRVLKFVQMMNSERLIDIMNFNPLTLNEKVIQKNFVVSSNSVPVITKSQGKQVLIAADKFLVINSSVYLLWRKHYLEETKPVAVTPAGKSKKGKSNATS